MQNPSSPLTATEKTPIVLFENDPLGCPRCRSLDTRKHPFWDKEPDASTCPVCKLQKEDVIIPDEQRLTSFEICATCVLRQQRSSSSFIMEPSIILSYSRSQGKYWWQPQCNNFQITRHEDGDKWGPKRTCPMRAEHIIINRPNFLFPVQDAYWKSWRMVLDGQMIIADEDNQYRMYLIDVQHEEKEWLDEYLRKVVPVSLTYHTTSSMKILLARALSLERLKRISHAAKEVSRMRWAKKMSAKMGVQA